MPGLFDVGKTALQSYRQSLSVTGQNIANINTEGYKRRDANLEEISGSQGGITSVASQAGLGVRVEEIRRAFDSYVVDRTRSANANFESNDALLKKLSELEDILLPQDSNLGIFLGRFFNSLQEIATAPGDTAPRIVAIETGKALANSFRQTSIISNELLKGTLKQANQDLTAVNVLAAELVKINAALMSSGKSGNANNAMLDSRDRLIDEISKFVEVTTDLDSRGAATLRLGNSGNGPVFVSNDSKAPITVSETLDGIQYSLSSGGKQAPTSQITSGALKGYSDAFTLIKKTISDIDEMAFVFTQQINAQHRQGLDLNNEKGRDLFGSTGFSVTQNPTNISNISAEAVINDISKVSGKRLIVSYDESSKNWIAYDDARTRIASGRNTIVMPGYEIRIAGNALNGEEFYISASDGFAKSLQFVITKPENIAAASTKITFADNNNDSSAEINATKISKISLSNVPQINDVLTNSFSAISATEFYKNGAIAHIPANTQAIELASLKQQPQVKFSLTDTQLANASTLSFSRATPATQSYQFNIAYGDIFQGETGNWPGMESIAKYLNQGALTTPKDVDGISVATTMGAAGNLTIGGVLTSSGTATFTDPRRISITSAGNDSALSFTITGTDSSGASQSEIVFGKNASTIISKKSFKTVTSVRVDGPTAANVSIGVAGLRLSDLGIYASGNQGNLSLALADGTLASTAPQIMCGGSAITGSILNGANASDMQIFTREGRHISGSPLTDEEVNTLLTSNNGFSQNAEYRADYLNGYGNEGYRGIEIDRTNSIADSVISIGGDGNSPRAFAAPSLVPDSPTEPWQLTIGGTKIIDITAGSSAGHAAKIINKQSSNFGVMATATSRVELKNGGDSGTVSFKIGSDNTDFIKIEARVSQTSMNTLAEKINLFTNKTGVSANVSTDQTRLILENFNGNDINITDFDFDGNVGETITATVIDNYSKPVSSAINLGGLQDEAKFSLTNGQVAKAQSLSFTIGTTRYNFDISYLSTMGTTGEWTDISDIAKHLNRGNMLASGTKLSDLGIYAEGSYGDISLRMNGNSYSSLLADKPILTATGESNLSGTISGSSRIGAAKFTGHLELISPESFTVAIDNQTVSSTIDERQNSLITQKPNKAGDTTEVLFNVFEGIDSDGADKDGLLANSAGASYTLTLPSSGSGPSFSATVNSSNTNPATPSSIAKKMSEKLRALAPIPSISGAIALTSLPNDQDSVMISFANENYKLTVSYADPVVKTNPEISVTGGEQGRLTAYFDSNNKLQISAVDGSLAASQFTILGNSVVTGNESASKRFGLTDDSSVAVRSITGRSFSPSATTQTNTFTLNGANVTITITPNGAGSYTLSSSSGTVTPIFADTGTATTSATSPKIILRTAENSGSIASLGSDTNSVNNFGFQIGNYSISNQNENLKISSTNDTALSISTSASSLVEERVSLKNLPPEDLIVILSGTGANRITANYDIAPASLLDIEENLTIKVIDDTGINVEVLDANTGHSIASRSLDSNFSTEAEGYFIQLTDKGSKNDTFQIASNKDGAGDARNLDAILSLQNSSSVDRSTGNFQEIFSGIVSTIGSSVNASELRTESAEALKDSAEGFESQFSGVNLDEEAANLIEQQQAYQASARILSTARELFDTLLESV